jgi:hypothetical protein
MVAVESQNDTEVGLAEFLSNRARHSSDARLAIDAAAGFAVAFAAALWRGPGWHILASASLCFFAYGVWGITDRELHDRLAAGRGDAAPLRWLRMAATIVGFGAAIAFVLTTFAALLGTIIS